MWSRYLEPEQFGGAHGLQQFLEVLRASPLQQLPVPDSFVRLERWHSLRHHDRETMSELIVREEELFTELQQALVRARKDKVGPGASPEHGPAIDSWDESTTSAAPEPRSMYRTPPRPSGVTSDFFEDELRGYRLLRAGRLSNQERQNVLVQTNNSTSFLLIRRALRTLYAEDPDRPVHHHKGRRIWYGESVDDWGTEDTWWHDDGCWDVDWDGYDGNYWYDVGGWGH